MEEYIGLYAYKNEGDFSNLIGKIEINEDKDFAYCLKLESGTVIGFNYLDEITIVEFG